MSRGKAKRAYAEEEAAVEGTVRVYVYVCVNGLVRMNGSGKSPKTNKTNFRPEYSDGTKWADPL